jgi:glutamate 5-kinase
MSRNVVKRLVVKIGSSLLTRKGGHLDQRQINRFVAELSALRKSGVDVLLVTSGAIAAGTSELGWGHRPHAMGQKQAAAAVGQPRLMETYRQLFRKRGVRVGQLLLTREDFLTRSRAQNAYATLTALLQVKAVPIINENDTVAVEEIRVGDNDTLAAFVAVLIKADLLILLTDVDGLMTAHPRQGKGSLIRLVKKVTSRIEALAHGDPGSDHGTGGMETKVRAAKIATSQKVNMVIASGRRAGILKRLVRGESVGTFFGKTPA